MKEVKIFDQEALIEHRFKNVQATHAVVFKGKKEDNLRDASAKIFGEQIIQMGSQRWEGSEGHLRLRHEIKELQNKLIGAVNAAQAPDATTLAALVEKIFVDMTRRAQESPDLTSLIATETTNFDYPELVPLRDILPYRGQFMQVSGTNDPVPLLEQATADTDGVSQIIYALGWKDSLRNLLFNRLHTMEKVVQGIVNADTDLRNSVVVGNIVGATYVASQQQAADATSGATYDEKVYNTIRKAIKKLKGLKDIQTMRPIATPSMTLLVNSANLWDIERCIYGQLDINGSAGTRGFNRQALPITQIITYDGGINDGFAWGKKTMSFPGVTAGKAYLFVPRQYLWVMNKRPLTMETSQGSALQLSNEEKAWYRVFAHYNKVFLGSSYPGTSVGAGYGAVVEITLPSE